MNNQKANASIGIFDSGVGGLTVARAIMQALPSENIVYFGDTARVPYGVKSKETIEHFTLEIAQFLQKQPVKLLVIACNTMAAVAATKVRQQADVPVLDVITVGAKVAVSSSLQQRIGIIGTPTTIHSRLYDQYIHALNPNAQVFSQACPLFVPLVEEGWLDHPVTRLTAQTYLSPDFIESIDTLVLGCTHYPLLQPLLVDLLGQRLTLVDSARSIAQEVADMLSAQHLLHPPQEKPRHTYYVTDIPLTFRAVGERFLQHPLTHLEIVHL